MSEELKAQDCELEYWNQQAEDYAQVQIPCEDLRAIINRAWEAPAFNSALTAAEAERNRAQLACQQIAERLTAANARAEAAEAREQDAFKAGHRAALETIRSIYTNDPQFSDYTRNMIADMLDGSFPNSSTLKGTPDGR